MWIGPVAFNAELPGDLHLFRCHQFTFLSRALAAALESQNISGMSYTDFCQKPNL
jgi:hypothetical protein